ncbi:MAG TPA: response regulator [Methanobacterium sp.]|jgi:DNA-binding response OmpR family regulator|nr:response regulator [Methanobacterium sp.]
MSTASKPLIFSLSRNKRNSDILVKILGEQGYEVAGFSEPIEMVSESKNREKVDLVLMDISSFNQNIWKSCEDLRILDIPFLVLSPQQHRVIEEQGMKQGAERVLVKPLVIKELLLLVKSLVEN